MPLWCLIPETNIRCWDVGGLYVYDQNSKTSKIYVCDNWDNEFTKYHELGHKIWIEYLTDKQRTEYAVLFNKAKYFYRDYSRSDELEDFADNYANLILKRNQKPDIQKRMRIIKKFIFWNI